jgi:hypothetical protein
MRVTELKAKVSEFSISTSAGRRGLPEEPYNTGEDQLMARSYEQRTPHFALPDCKRPQEGSRHARRRLRAKMRRLQKPKAPQPQPKGVALSSQAASAAVEVSDSLVAAKRSIRTYGDGFSRMQSMLPTFTPIASNTTFGPLTDISMGEDGTLWGIDDQGAPHVYDAINNVWAQHGDGVDAAACPHGGQYVAYLFMGSQVVTVSPMMQVSAPQPIGTVWPDLPDSFKLGVIGAAGLLEGSGLVLFNGGRYATTDNSVPMGRLTDLAGWPQTANWVDGVIDSVYDQ